jgi:hypothetical protein
MDDQERRELMESVRKSQRRNRSYSSRSPWLSAVPQPITLSAGTSSLADRRPLASGCVRGLDAGGERAGRV